MFGEPVVIQQDTYMAISPWQLLSSDPVMLQDLHGSEFRAIPRTF